MFRLRKYLIQLILIFLASSLTAQVYHHKTGLIIPNGKPGQILWSKGTFHGYPAEFGTLIAKENPKSYTSKLITIPVIRIKKIASTKSNIPIFVLHGGPGESNLQDKLLFSDLLQHHDLVFVGYRGVDGSTRLDCPQVSEVLLSKNIDITNAKNRFIQAFNSCMAQWETDKVDLYGYSMDYVLNDVELVRKSLKYPKINFLAFSYGTMLAQRYASQFPQNISKMSLIGARPHNDFLFSADEYEKQMIRLYKMRPNQGQEQAIKNQDDALLAMDSLFSRIKTNTASINQYRLLFYGFSKLYSAEDLDVFFDSYNKAQEGNTLPLEDDFNRFYKNFPGELVMGDMIVKKQKSVNFEDSIKLEDKLSSSIVNAVNWFYTPYSELLIQENKNDGFKLDASISIQLIAGEYDIASPLDRIKSMECSTMDKTELIVIPQSGHMDLLLSRHHEVGNYLLDFFD